MYAPRDELALSPQGDHEAQEPVGLLEATGGRFSLSYNLGIHTMKWLLAA